MELLGRALAVGPLGCVQYASRKWVVGVCVWISFRVCVRVCVCLCERALSGRGCRVCGWGEAVVRDAGAREGGLEGVGRRFVW